MTDRSMPSANRRLHRSSVARLAVVLIGSAAAVAAQAPAQVSVPAGIERVTSVEGITEYRMGNGLRVLLFPDPSKQTITVNVTYLVGSRHENYGESGMAHLLEHLLFKGTPRHSNVTKEISDHGARANGTTWFDRTNYFETFAASDENLAWALDLEADRMVNAFVTKKDLDSEMTVVRNEFERDESRALGVLFDRVMSTAFLWHNYGRSTIGARSDIENVPIERLQAFYREHYQPDNAVLLVAGRFDETKALELVKQFFAPTPKPTRTQQALYTVEPTQDGERLVTVRRVGNLQYAVAGYHVPSGTHGDFPAVSLLVHILGDSPSGRLHKGLVETRKATTTLARAYQLHDPGFAMFGAEVRQESPLDDARETLIRTIEELAANPPTLEELDRARAALLKQIDLDLNSSNRVGIQLSEWIGMGDWRLLFLNRDRLRQATLEDVRRVAAKYFKSSNRTVGLFVPTASPDRVEIPSSPDVATMLKGYTGDTAVSAGEAFDPSPAAIEPRTVRTSLPGGLTLTLLPKKTRGSTVNATLTLRFGDEKSLANRVTAAQVTSALLLRGTSKRSRQQLRDDLDRLKARLTVGGGTSAVTATFDTVRQSLPAVLTLVAEVLRAPAFPATEFDQIKQQRLANLEQQKSDPQAIASNVFERHLRPYPKGDVRDVRTPDEAIADLNATSLEDVKKFFADFYGASNGELAMVGDFDASEVSSAVADLLGGWKSPGPFARIADPYREIPPVRRILEAPDKANAYFIAGTPINVRDDEPDYPALVLGNFMLGGGFLNSRLAIRIRQKDGISYSVGTQLQVSSFDSHGTFVMRAIYAPQNASRLEAAFKEEVARALAEGFSDEELKNARSGWLQARQVGRAQDGELAARLAALSYPRRTITWDGDLERRIEALTPGEIQAALRRHIDVGKMTIVKAGDFTAAARIPSQ